MTDQFIMPPAHLWSKIEQRLDEQDERRKTSDELISAAFSNAPTGKRRTFYLAAFACASVVASFVWLKM